MNQPGGYFANGVVWYTIVFQISAFHFFTKNWSSKLSVSKILSSVQITITVEEPWFS